MSPRIAAIAPILLAAGLAACSRSPSQAAAFDGGFVPAAAARPSPRGAGQVLRMEPAMIVDWTGFERPIAAATLFLPFGWRSDGGVLWGRELLCTNGYVFHWTAVSPDASTTIAVLPQDHWETSNYGAAPSLPGCAAPFSNVRQYLEYKMQQWRPGARALDYRPRPDIARTQAGQNRSVPMPMGELRTTVEAGELLFAYSERGVAMRGSISALVVFHLSRSNSGMGQVLESLSATSQPVYAVAAPDGRLDFGFFEAIRRSIVPDPQWSQRIGRHDTQIARVSLEESRRQAEMLRQSNAEIARIRQDAWNASQVSADRRAHEFGELMRGIETYADPNAPGGTVELSRNYDHAWRLNDGSYVLTNDASFDPWRDLKLEGRRLAPTP